MELLIALAILCIIMTSVFSFFQAYQRYGEKMDDQLELQYQAQIAVNEFLNKVMYSQGIQQVSFHDESQHKVKKIVFRNSPKEDEIHPKYKKLVFEHKRASASLWYGYGNDANVQYANYIKDFVIIPIDGEYKECKGIRVIITCQRRGKTLTIENSAFFRNIKSAEDK
jgi:type II secretory pathway pseudopilin PulG